MNPVQTMQMESENPAIDPLIGKIISERYRVLERIGRGGFGAVYKVQHIRLDKTLALKVLFEHTHQNPRMIKRFEREARATCRIGHDNIVEITDFARDRRVGYYFVMEYLDGETLSERLRKLGPMPAARMVHIGCQIADALAATHSKGIVHRDLKPDNTFLVRKRHEEDFVKVLDFGIAAMGDLEEPGPRLTRHGAMLGTPAYMSPEQAEGKPADHRADIYSLGIILYELATGKVPYRNAAAMAVLEMHRSTEPVPPRKARPDLDLPPALEQVILRCLRKPVTQRYQSMREVYNDLVTVSQRIDMSSVLGRRPDLRVDTPPPPPPDDVEVEEPEWLDEDLVLLDDSDAIEEIVVDGQEAVVAAVTMPMVDFDPTMPDQPLMYDGSDSGEAMELDEADIVSSALLELPDDHTAPPLPTEIIAAESVIVEPTTEWSPPQQDGFEPTVARVAESVVVPANTEPPIEPTAVRTPSGAIHTARVRRPTPSLPIWQRPPVLILIGFGVTLVLGAVVLALMSSGGKKTEADPGAQAEQAASKTGAHATVEPAGPGTAVEDDPLLDELGDEDPALDQPAAENKAVIEAAPEKPADEAVGAAPAVPQPELLPVLRRAPALEVARMAAGPTAEFVPQVTRRTEGDRERRPRAVIELVPSEVVVLFESEPPGAKVFRGKDELGETPCELTLPRLEAKTTFRFDLKGFAANRTKLTLTESTTVRVKLRKRGAGGGGQRGGNTYDLF